MSANSGCLSKMAIRLSDSMSIKLPFLKAGNQSNCSYFNEKNLIFHFFGRLSMKINENTIILVKRVDFLLFLCATLRSLVTF